MLNLTKIGKQEKNKLFTNSSMILLLDIIQPGIDKIHICYNTDNVSWNDSVYQAFPFELGVVQEDTTGSIPTVELKVSNVTRALGYWLENGKGGTGAKVILRVVNSKALAINTPECEERFTVTKTTITDMWVTFTLGSAYPSMARRPWSRYLKNHCRFKYKSAKCGAKSDLPACGHTLIECRARNNSRRFGGFFGIPQGGQYV